MYKLISALTVASMLFISGCSSSSKKTSPLDSQWQGKGKSYTYKKFTKPKKWAPGQYVVLGNINDGEKESITKTLIVRKERGGWVIESITTNADKEVTGMQMLIKGYESAVNKKDTSLIKVEWVKILQKDGKVDKIDGQAMVLYSVMMKSALEKMVISATSFSSGGAVSVPAGNFAGTTVASTSVKILFKTFKQTSWMHPDVPVNGVVKSASDDNENISELIDFGFNGKPVIQ